MLLQKTCCSQCGPPCPYIHIFNVPNCAMCMQRIHCVHRITGYPAAEIAMIRRTVNNALTGTYTLL